MVTPPKCAVIVLGVWLLTGCGGVGMPDIRGEDDLPTAHPRDVAATVNAQVADIEKGLPLNESFERKKGQVSPGPCGDDWDRRHVKGWGDRNPNPNRDSWYVSFSPYSIAVISRVDLPPSVNIWLAMRDLQAHLRSSGWKIVSFAQPSGGRWSLKAESPAKGYGGVLEGPVADGHRITLTFFSPCFRHPDELPK